jgi:ribonuclease D
MPRDGVPAVIETMAALHEAADRIAAGVGPIAVDAERASGYRYGQRAYLVQLRREGAGTALLDPMAIGDLSPLAAAMSGVEWVLHAASQDLPCLREIGLEPDSLFDTELAGRILGRPRVGLAALVEQELGLGLAKEHSAVDWSTRPLPQPWLVYAALDVEVLVELRDKLDEALLADGKREWAHEEFEAARRAPTPPPRVDPWRRTSGLHKVRSPRQLAIVRSLWLARDQVAQRTDTAPGRIIPDSSLLAVGLQPATPAGELISLPGFVGRGVRRHLSEWTGALVAGQQLADSELPATTMTPDGPPPPRAWSDRDPAAALRLAAVRAAVATIADEVGTPAENVLPPDTLKRLCWIPPRTLDQPSIAAAMAELGARQWQIDLTSGAISAALAAPAETPAPEPLAPTVELDRGTFPTTAGVRAGLTATPTDGSVREA